MIVARVPETFAKNPNGIPSKNPQLIFSKLQVTPLFQNCKMAVMVQIDLF